jgi:hypothetical protein
MSYRARLSFVGQSSLATSVPNCQRRTGDGWHESSASQHGNNIWIAEQHANALIYLDMKNWTNYVYQEKSDITYIEEIGREGFHNFHRNCQHFTSWNIKAVWPKSSWTATRADPLLGKLLLWFRDWERRGRWGRWGANKFKGETWLTNELDSCTEFVGRRNVTQFTKRSRRLIKKKSWHTLDASINPLNWYIPNSSSIFSDIRN